MFAERITAIRKAAGHTRPQMAEALGISQSTVISWEHQQRMPSLDMLIKLADLYQVTTDELLGRPLPLPAAPPAPNLSPLQNQRLKQLIKEAYLLVLQDEMSEHAP